MGGMLRAIEKGWVQAEIERAAYEYQRAVERGEAVVVGVNRYAAEEEPEVPVLRIEPECERTQVADLRRLREGRNANAVKVALARLGEDAESSVNLMPGILRAVEAYATVGEVSDALRKVFGEYRERTTL